MTPPDVAALLARVEEREGPVFDISLHTSVKWITPDHHVPIYLEDIWAAYVAGAQSGQRHPNASRALLNQSADAYVKSQFMTDLNTGETNRTDILVPALATALRAALADQRRIDWLDTQRRPYSLPPTRMIVGTEWSVKLHHQEQPNATLRAAIDAAMTADGGVL